MLRQVVWAGGSEAAHLGAKGAKDAVRSSTDMLWVSGHRKLAAALIW